jgi:hypothetical protein
MFTNLVFSWDASSSFGPMDSFNVYLLSSEPQPASPEEYYSVNTGFLVMKIDDKCHKDGGEKH